MHMCGLCAPAHMYTYVYTHVCTHTTVTWEAVLWLPGCPPDQKAGEGGAQGTKGPVHCRWQPAWPSTVRARSLIMSSLCLSFPVSVKENDGVALIALLGAGTGLPLAPRRSSWLWEAGSDLRLPAPGFCVEGSGKEKPELHGGRGGGWGKGGVWTNLRAPVGQPQRPGCDHPLASIGSSVPAPPDHP